MEKAQEKIYQELTEYCRRNSENLITDLDLLQSAMVKILETGKEFNDDNHFRNYLKAAVKTRRIDIAQQKDNLVSLSSNDKETDLQSFLVSIPEKDYTLFKWILTQRNGKGNYLFTTKQRKVIAKKYLSGKTQNEIAKELKLNQSTVSRLIATIDCKLLSLPIKDMVGSWYHGAGFVSRSDVWNVYPDIKPTKIGYLKWYKRTGNPKDLDKFRNDSKRNLQAHVKRIGNTAIPIFNDSPIPDGIPATITCNIPISHWDNELNKIVHHTLRKATIKPHHIEAHVIAERKASQLPAHVRYAYDPMKS